MRIMAKRTGYITKNVKGKERVVFFTGSFSVTQGIKSVVQRTTREINRRYGKGTAYFRKTSKGDSSNDYLPIWSVFIKK
jgi:SMC interacting uncharacterized protein involved in chromosome segregation